MTLQEFSNKLFEYPKLDNALRDVHDVSAFLKKVGEFFLQQLHDIDDICLAKGSFPGRTPMEKKDRLIIEVESFVHNFENAVQNISREPDSWKVLYELFFDKSNELKTLKAREILAGTDFYRMRSASEYKMFKPHEMFVIQESHLELVGQYRFNIAGNPGLYLAGNLYLAWEESRRPDFNTVNFSRFQNKQKLSVLRLTIPYNMQNSSDVICAYLALLCSVKTIDANKYKYQYDIPNIISYLVGVNISKGGKLSGIQYISSRRFDCEDFMFRPREISDAYIFMSDNRTGHRLEDKFMMTQPRSYFLYKIHSFSFADKFAKLSDYNESLFYSLEKQLKKEKLMSCLE